MFITTSMKYIPTNIIATFKCLMGCLSTLFLIFTSLLDRVERFTQDSG